MDLLEGLEDLGMMDNTAIVFTSDHGEMHSAHGLKGKGGFIYENNVHVPLIIYYPGMEGGRSIDAVTSHIDLAPTIIDMANISEEEKEKLSEGMTRHSLMGLLAGEEDTVRDGALFCYEMLSFNTAVEKGEDGELGVSFDERNFVRAVFTERYKFGRYFSPNDFNTPETYEELTEHNDLELYDLENNPYETHNLAQDPEYKELVMEMNGLLNQLIEEEIGVDDGSEIEKVKQKFAELGPELKNLVG